MERADRRKSVKGRTPLIPPPPTRLLWALTFVVLLINGILLSVGVPLGFLDGRFHYSASEIQRVLLEQGEAGRLLYSQLETIDLLFILLYTWLLVELTRALRRGVATRVPAALAYLPIGIATAADAVETLGLLSLLGRFPDAGPWELSQLISWATPVKWAALAVAAGQLAWLALLKLNTHRQVRGAD